MRLEQNLQLECNWNELINCEQGKFMGRLMSKKFYMTFIQ